MHMIQWECVHCVSPGEKSAQNAVGVRALCEPWRSTAATCAGRRLQHTQCTRLSEKSAQHAVGVRALCEPLVLAEHAFTERTAIEREDKVAAARGCFANICALKKNRTHP